MKVVVVKPCPEMWWIREHSRPNWTELDLVEEVSAHCRIGTKESLKVPSNTRSLMSDSVVQSCFNTNNCKFQTWNQEN